MANLFPDCKFPQHTVTALRAHEDFYCEAFNGLGKTEKLFIKWLRAICEFD